ncbi:WbqC family protein [Nonomuraea sp. NEAU-A123]|nr:WbqC family protein [Nonomuraea sp. NEAU-A123]
MAKLFTADYWIVLDDVQFARRDYQHRARLASLDGSRPPQWLSIATHLPHGRSRCIVMTGMSANVAVSRRSSPPPSWRWAGAGA